MYPLTKQSFLKPDNTYNDGAADASYNTAAYATIAAGSTPLVHNPTTGTFGCYSIRNLPVLSTKTLGTDRFTVLKVNTYNMYIFQACGFFDAQAQLLVDDFKKYAYYRCVSITYKFVPKYPAPPSKIANYVNVPQYMGTSPGTEGFRWLTTGVTVPAQGDLSVVDQTSKLQSSFVSTNQILSAWDVDAQNLIAYVIPQTYQNGVDSPTSLFSSINAFPGYEWFSNFRKAGFKRVFLKQTRPTSIKVRLPPATDVRVLDLPAFGSGTFGGLPYIPANNGKNIFNFPILNQVNKVFENSPPGYVRAAYDQLWWYTTTDTTVNYERHKIAFPHFHQVFDSLIFIPGITLPDLLERFDIIVSFKIRLMNRTLDLV